MSSESSFPRCYTEYEFDGDNRLREVRQFTGPDGLVKTTNGWGPEPAPPSFAFEHDNQKPHFVLTWSDGRTERFRDDPTRHLVLEPDPETGEMRPVTRCGQPMYLYFCREEREL